MTLLIVVAMVWLTWGWDPVSVVVGTGVAVLGWEASASVFWPFTPCPAPFCSKGKVRRPGHKSWRKCGWCGGAGSRIRWGRRMYESLRPTKHGRR